MDFLFIYITILVLLETYRVFGKKWNTKQVYEQGIKEVALAVVRDFLWIFYLTEYAVTDKCTMLWIFSLTYFYGFFYLFISQFL